MQPKLTYFGVYARAEPMRMLLAHAKVSYEDDRMDFAEFGKRKAAGFFPNGQAPLWFQDGNQYFESLAILRFIGRQHGYYPPEFHDMWRCDSIIDFTNDFLQALSPLIMIGKTSEEDKKTYISSITKLSEHLNKILGHGKSFLCGDKLSNADFFVFALVMGHVFNDAYGAGAAWTNEGK